MRERPGVLLFGLVLGVYCLTAAGHLQTSDVGGELQVAQSLVTKDHFLQMRDAYGWHYNQHGLGESLLLVPAVLAGFAFPARAHAITVLTGSFLNPVCAALTVAVFFATLRALAVEARRAVALSALLAFATTLFAYAHDAYDVTPAGLFLALAFLAAVRGAGGDRRWWLLAGAAAGAAALVRQPALVCAPGLAYMLFATVPRTRRMSAAAAAAGAGAAFLAVMGAYNAYRFGNPLQSGFNVLPDAPADFHLAYLPAGLATILFSPGGSVFLYSPPLVAGVLAIPAAFRKWPAATVACVYMAAATALFSALYYEPTGGAWGSRYMVPVTAFMLLPVAAAGLRAIWWAILAAAGAMVQLLGVAVDYELQRQLALDAGHSQYMHWDFVHTPLAQHAAAVFEVARGHATYPASRLAGDAETGRPPVTTWDFWWVYAWITGTARAAAALTAGLLAALTAFCALGLARSPAAKFVRAK